MQTKHKQKYKSLASLIIIKSKRNKRLILLVPGLFVPWTNWTNGLFVPCNPGLFVPSMDYSYLGLFVPWTVHTLLDCSYHGLFVPSLDFSYPGLFVPWIIRTLLDCSYHGLFVPSVDDSYRAARLTKINVSYQNVPVFSESNLP